MFGRNLRGPCMRTTSMIISQPAHRAEGKIILDETGGVEEARQELFAQVAML